MTPEAAAAAQSQHPAARGAALKAQRAAMAPRQPLSSSSAAAAPRRWRRPGPQRAKKLR
jgi:hypothetical protein